MNDPIAARVRAIVAREAGMAPGALTDDARLDDELGCDSLTRIEISMAIEEAFGIEIDEDSVEDVRTVADAVALARRLTATPASTDVL